MRMQENMKEYLTEKEAREKRLAVYTEKIQETDHIGVRPYERISGIRQLISC